MTDLRQAAQQALEALEGLFGLTSKWEGGGVVVWRLGGSNEPRKAITALKAELEQQAEPTPWRDMVVVSLVREGINKHKARELADHFAAQQQAEPPPEWLLIKNIITEYGLQAISFVAEWKAAQKAEPVATVTSETGNSDITMSWWHEPALPVGTKLYTAPPQRQWQGLEAEDLAQIESDEFWQTGNHMAIAVAVEAKLKERNNV